MNRTGALQRISAIAFVLSLLPLALADPVHAAEEGETIGRIERVNERQIVVKKLSDRKVIHTVRRVFARGEGTVVGGKRKSWEELENGDKIKVAWTLGKKRPIASKVTVLARAGEPQKKASARRQAQGWVAGRAGDTLTVRTLVGHVVKFERTAKTTVAKERSSWDELRRGDRVGVTYKVGPGLPTATEVVVYRRSEEEPDSIQSPKETTGADADEKGEPAADADKKGEPAADADEQGEAAADPTEDRG